MNQHDEPEVPSPKVQSRDRRDFLKLAAGASALVLTAGGLSLALRDPHGPPAVRADKALSGLGDFSVARPDNAPRLAIVHGKDRAAMLERAVAALGGIEAFVKKGERVCIKLNAAFATPASLGATTHPALLAAMVGLCRKAGAARVFIADNPINSPESCFELSGLAEAARTSGATLIMPRPELFVPATLPQGTLIRDWPVMAGALKGADKVIALAPLKDHHRAGASMLLKNFYGLLGGRRNVFHQDINGIIAELSLLLKPSLCILDGTVAMMSNGPTGGSLSDLKDTDTLIASTDPVAADALGCELLGRTLADIPYIRLAETFGAGRADYKSYNPAVIDARV